jgi:hypothetical protein
MDSVVIGGGRSKFGQERDVVNRPALATIANQAAQTARDYLVVAMSDGDMSPEEEFVLVQRMTETCQWTGLTEAAQAAGHALERCGDTVHVNRLIEDVFAIQATVANAIGPRDELFALAAE